VCRTPLFIADARLPAQLCVDAVRQALRPTLTGVYREFPSAHRRFEYFRSESPSFDYLAHEEFTCRVTVISGLPGAGKDTWISGHMPDVPVVSLDALRPEPSEEREITISRRMAEKIKKTAEIRDNSGLAGEECGREESAEICNAPLQACIRGLPWKHV
jgi:hypothetical protein